MSKTKPVKARSMWEADESHAIVTPWQQYNGMKLKPQHPVLVLPGDAESYDAMVERLARVLVYRSAIDAEESPEYAKNAADAVWRNCIPDAHQLLAALGITRPKETARNPSGS